MGAIDFDMASPGPRLWDLAYLAYSFVIKPWLARVPKQKPVLFESLDALLRVYGPVNLRPYSLKELWEMMLLRLKGLLDWTQAQVEQAQPELQGHVDFYIHQLTVLQNMSHESFSKKPFHKNQI